MPEAPSRRWVLLAAATLFCVLLAGGYLIFRYNNPFFMYMPQFRQSQPLMDAVRARPLTPDEFEQAVGLFQADDDIVKLRAYAIVALAADKSPEYRPAARAAFTRAASDPDLEPRTRGAAAAVLARVKPDDEPVPAAGAGVSQPAP